MITPGSEKIHLERQEQFSQSIAKGVSPIVSFMKAYDMQDRREASRKASRLKKHPVVAARIEYLQSQNPNNLDKNGVDLKSAIRTCKDVIDDLNSTTPQRMKAVEVLNKLGVFDNDEKDDGKRMDPGAICEYLAQFAGNPAKELARIPGGLKGLLKMLMELTGATKEQIRDTLDDTNQPIPASEPSKQSETPMLAGVEVPETKGETRVLLDPGQPVAPEPKIDEDGDLEDDETLVDVITGQPVGEVLSEESKERLAPALELAGQLKKETDGTGLDQGPCEVYQF